MKVGCSRCGSNIVFIPSTQKFHCNHCGMDSDISEYDNFVLDNDEKQDYDECTCSSCGAKLIVGENTTITVCVYCGSNQIIKNRFVGDFKPDEIIPFQIDQKKFVNIYREFIKKKIFAPNDFRTNAKITQVKGLYVPYYVYLLNNNTYARGEGCWSSYDDTSYMYFETKFNVKFLLPQDASLKINDNSMTSLEPFNYENSKKFNPAYLNGFSAENGDEKLENLERKSWRRGAMEATKLLNKRMKGGYRFTGGKMETKFDLISRKYILTPIWFFSTKYNNRTYRFAMNGQTGKVVGEVPQSKIKLTLLGLIIFLIYSLIFDLPFWYLKYNHDIILMITLLIFGGFFCLIILGIIKAIYNVSIKPKYENVNKVLSNDIQFAEYQEDEFIKYSKQEYDNKFSKEDYQKLDITILNNNEKVENYYKETVLKNNR